MHSKTIQNLNYFVGKVCTIVTFPINRNLDEARLREMFVVRIGEITYDGIWGTHPYNQELVSFFPIQHVISIVQEAELDVNNPEHKEMIAQYEKKTGKKVVPDIINKSVETKPEKKTMALPVIEKIVAPEVIPDTEATTVIDVEQLERLASFTKTQFDQIDKFKTREPL